MLSLIVRNVRADPPRPRARREPARGASLVALAVVLSGCSETHPAGRARPNIVLVTLDTTRADRLGTYGCAECETPAFDGLAAQGALYRRAWTVAPLTTPAHASLMTGLLPSRHGVRDNGRARIPTGVPTLAELLGGAGYETGAFVGAFPVSRLFGFGRGFDHFDDSFGSSASAQARSERPAQDVNAHALPWLSERLSRSGPSEGPPVFAWIHYFDAHVPYAAPPLWARRFAGRPYDAEVAWADRALGQVITVVASSPAAGRTVIIVVGDHGEGLGDHGELTHGVLVNEETVRIPLVMAGAGWFPRGVVREELVSLVDIFATTLAIAGLDAVPPHDGRDLTTAPADRPPASGALGRPGHERPVVAEALYGRNEFGWAPLFAVRVRDDKWISAPRPERFELGRDPGEHENLTGRDPARDRELAELLDRVLIEASRERAAESPVDDMDALAKLQALGYVGGAAFREPVAGARAVQGRDPKDAMADYQRYQAALNDVRRGGEACLHARDVLADLVLREPRNPEYRYRRAAAERCAGDIAAAEQTLQELTVELPDYVLAFRQLAAIHAAAGRHAAAVATWERLRLRHPALVGIDLSLAQALLDAGRPEDALAMAEGALAAWGARADLLTVAGDAEAALGRPAAAWARYREAIALDAVSLEALAGLARLAVAGDVGRADGDFRALVSECVSRAPHDAGLRAFAGRLDLDSPPPP